MSVKIITLTSDFGLKDPYVAEMKAAILGICPHAVIVDVTHMIDKFNMRMAAFVLASADALFSRRFHSCGCRRPSRWNPETPYYRGD